MLTKSSKSFSIIIISLFCFLFISCSAVMSPLPVTIHSNAKFPLAYESGYDGDMEYIVLGTVVGKATATSILGLFASGDASIATAYQNAKDQFPKADCLTEISIDYSTSSVLGIFASITTIVKAKAIRFKDGTRVTEEKKEIYRQEDKKNITRDEKTKLLSNETIKESDQSSMVKESSKSTEFVGEWELISTKSPDGKVQGPESGLSGTLILTEDKNVNLTFDQSGKKVEFTGSFYFDDKGSMTIEVEQIDLQQSRSKISYKNVQIKDRILILLTEAGREYHFKK